MDVSPKQPVSVATSLIPFLGNTTMRTELSWVQTCKDKLFPPIKPESPITALVWNIERCVTPVSVPYVDVMCRKACQRSSLLVTSQMAKKTHMNFQNIAVPIPQDPGQPKTHSQNWRRSKTR